MEKNHFSRIEKQIQQDYFIFFIKKRKCYELVNLINKNFFSVFLKKNFKIKKNSLFLLLK